MCGFKKIYKFLLSMASLELGISSLKVIYWNWGEVIGNNFREEIGEFWGVCSKSILFKFWKDIVLNRKWYGCNYCKYMGWLLS